MRENRAKMNKVKIPFSKISIAANGNALEILNTWLPNGKVSGNEYVVLNPRRNDFKLGSFKINYKTGKWADFATDDAGGDLISLGAYIFDISQSKAAIQLAAMMEEQTWP